MNTNETAGSQSEAASGERPHHAAKGSVASFDVTLRVDTKRLANEVSEGDHDALGLLGAAHTVEHAMAAAYLNRVLEGDLVVLEARPQAVVNQGNNGFHLLTIVTDGYGDVVAEAEDGTAMGREEVPEVAPEKWDLRMAVTRLAARVLESGPAETAEALEEKMAELEKAAGGWETLTIMRSKSERGNMMAVSDEGKVLAARSVTEDGFKPEETVKWLIHEAWNHQG